MLPLSKRRALARMVAHLDRRRMSEITADGWFTFAERFYGPPHKTNGGRNGGKGFVPHSAEGYQDYLAYLLQHGPASWGASNLKDGRLLQHYPITSQTWTSGAGYPNNNFFSNETEGVAGEPLTDGQVDNIVRQIRALSTLQLWVPRRPRTSLDKSASLYEHRECVRWGAEATSCPSGRIPWDRIMAELEKEDDMKVIRVWCVERQQTYLVAGTSAVPVRYPADDKELEKLYGAHAAVLSGAQLDAMVAK